MGAKYTDSCNADKAIQKKKDRKPIKQEQALGSEDEWREEYERNRYLRELPDVALQDRLNDLTSNLWSTDAAGQVMPPRSSENRRGILRLIVHTLLEQMARSKTATHDFSERALREMASAYYKPPRLLIPFKDSPSCIAKFGKRGHIRDAFKHGRLRIAPAAAYNDSSLNAAQADKELEHYSVTPNESLLFSLHGLNATGEEVEFPVQYSELFRYLMVQDFYVWCCGLGYDARLFRDFEAEAVLVIRKKEAFRTRLSAAVEKQLPNAELIDGPLRYYDPYTIQRDQLVPIFSKNVRYLYQNEYRFAWKMPKGSTLVPFFVEIGTLDDIAEFLELA